MQGHHSFLTIAIQERLKQMAPSIREVAEDRGQLEGYFERPPVAFPCCLVDFDVKFDDLGMGEQEGEGEVIIRLAFPPFSSSSSLMPEDIRKKGLAYSDIETEVVRALHGWAPGGLQGEDERYIYYFQELSRRGQQTERRDDPLRVRELRFATLLQDASTKEEYVKATISSTEIEPEVDADL